MARQFNLIPPVCETMSTICFREKGGDAAPRLYHKIGSQSPHPCLSLGLTITEIPFPHPVLSVLGVGSVTWSPLAVASSLASMMGVPDTCRVTIKGEIWGLG